MLLHFTLMRIIILRTLQMHTPANGDVMVTPKAVLADTTYARECAAQRIAIINKPNFCFSGNFQCIKYASLPSTVISPSEVARDLQKLVPRAFKGTQASWPKFSTEVI